MAPTNSKANYKTYEAQARMVRAIVAAHPDVKWNYKGKLSWLAPRCPLCRPVSITTSRPLHPPASSLFSSMPWDGELTVPEIAACYGSDMTEHALNHRFRRLRAQALIIREGRPQGFDMKHLSVEDNMPTAQDAVDKTSTSLPHSHPPLSLPLPSLSSAPPSPDKS